MAEERSKQQADEHSGRSEGFQWKERYEAAVLASGSVLYDWHASTNEVTYGGSLKEVLGYDAQEMKGGLPHWESLIHPDDRAEFSSAIRKLIETGGGARLEYRVRRKDGEFIHVEDRGRFIKDEHGKVVRMIGFVSDVTDRKRAEEELTKKNELMALLTETIEQVFWMSTPGVGKILYISPGFERMWGFKGQDLYRDPHLFIEAVHPDDRHIVAAAVKEHARGRYECEYRIVTPDGSVRWIYDKGYPVYGGDGTLRMMAGTATDITDRKRVEESLQTSQAFLDRVVDLSPFPMWIADAEGTLRRSNKALREALHVNDEQIVGKYNVLQDMNLVLQGVMPLVQGVFEKQEPTRFSVSWSGHRVDDVDFSAANDLVIDVSIFPIAGADGRLAHVVCQWVDVTERVEALKLLSEHEQRLNTLISNIPGAAYVCASDPDWTVFYMSGVIERISGYAPEELTLNRVRSFGSIIHPDDRKRIEDEVFQPVEEGKPYEVEYRILCKDGAVRWLRDRGRSVVDPHGRTRRLHGVLFDITEQKKAEKIIRESERRFRELFSNMRDGWVMTDLEGRILECNAAYQRMLGYTLGELKELRYQQITPSKWHAIEAAIVRNRILKKGYSGIYEKEYKRNDGTVFPVELSSYLVNDAEGNAVGMWGLVRDITERKRVEEELKKHADLLVRMERMAKVGGWEADLASGEVTWTDGTYRIHEVGKDFEPDLENAIDFFDPRDVPTLRAAMQKAFEDNKPYDLELRLITGRGNRLWTRSIGQRVATKGAKLQGSFQDITELKEVELMRERLLRGASHSLKTPVALLEMAMDLMKKSMRSQDPEKLNRAWRIASDNVRSIRRDVDKIIQASALDLIKAGNMFLKGKGMLTRAANAYAARVRHFAEYQRVAFDIDISASADHVAVRDQDLRIVIDNLLDNAFKFTQKGSVSLRARVRGKAVEVRIEDTGRGITAAQIKRIFERFFQAYPSVEGVGLGLSICKDIVERYGGTIEVRSKGKGKGTIVTLRLPRSLKSSVKR